jgi:hypothetical protein
MKIIIISIIIGNTWPGWAGPVCALITDDKFSTT